ncbi:hypothetical protein HELRODRAFT_98446 [Helobdella robusta]|uniref:Ubiquitin-related modifier 1 homolog n=1 Tax=Helobdella robusta TaxID=6412 RepID=T1G9M8_HELRO|nr:hypothetical protein HELRODRAFT_98446 [Helobdella robusta]ESO07706.1 hypothetical protein HELRODRAFT_98446 [Helobdella robusta]
MNILIEFRGGAELMFDHMKLHNITLPLPDEEQPPWTMKLLLDWIKLNMIRENADLFIQAGTIKPGILVLINDEDWELCGQLDYEIQDNDQIVFISTLHGG